MTSSILKAGVGKVDITATAGEPTYAGYPPKAMAHIPHQYRDMKVTVDDPLYARALVLDDGRQQIVIVVLDCCAIAARTTSQYILYDSPDDFMPRLRQRVEAEIGISGMNVNVSAIHTHPPGRLLCSEEEQIRRTLAAIRQAWDNRVEVTLGVGAGHEDTLTFNRTWLMKDGSDFSWRPEPPGEEILSLRPIDPEIGIVRIDRLDGRPLAVVYDFASHLLVGCRKGAITADFPAVTSRYIEERIGHDAMAIFLQGANGDLMEVAYDDPDNPRTKFDFGHQLGRSVMKAYTQISTGSAILGLSTRHVNLPLRQDIAKEIERIQLQQDELVRSIRYTDLSFKTFLPLYLKYKLNPDFPNHVPQRYLAADACGDRSLREQDEINRIAVDKYLQSLRAMELISGTQLQIATLQKHQEIITELGGQSVQAEIKAIRIGSCVFIAAPIEIVAQIGFNLKKMSPFEQTYVISDANGYLHYGVPAAFYGRGGYEATECMLGPEWESIFYQAVQELFDELMAAATSSEGAMHV